MSAHGQWVIGYRPFAKPTPAFTVYQLQQIGSDLKAIYVQDERTGDDALFATKAQARVALRSVTKPAKFNAAQTAERIAANVRDVETGAIDWPTFSARQRAAWMEADRGELCVIGSAASRRVAAVHAALKQVAA